MNFRLFLLVVLLSTRLAFGQSPLPLIPKPVSIEIKSAYFDLSEAQFLVGSEELNQDANLFIEQINLLFQTKITAFVPGKNLEAKKKLITITEGFNEHKDGYTLNISQDRVDIEANGAGAFYALQTMVQLAKKEGGKLLIPASKIIDYPRYEWRGMHLDVCRHFFPKEFVKKYIDQLALHKMNSFHWHLTEDQGWRIEIKKYPKLTSIGAYRKGSMIGRYSDHNYDTLTYGGYYTQDDIKEIVAYASARHINIVPEIEMPGHSLAALAAYPELACTIGPFEVAKQWGVFNEVYCAGKEETFTFLSDVLSEVMELFPSKIIHIGGDECPKESWKKCEKCQTQMKQNQLKDEHELQSYFIQRIEKFVNSKGRQIIGWDEILEGGLAPNAAVMSWRGTEGGIAAAKQKHKVVMSPGSHCYFDHYQANPLTEPIAIGGFTTLEKVYGYEPTPSELNTEEASYILGAQANLWSEYILSEKQAEYMAFPRAFALAEVLWSPKENRNYQEFTARLSEHFSLLDLYGLNYSKALYEVEIVPSANPDSNQTIVTLSNNSAGQGNIFYTLNDGTEQAYTTPIEIKQTSKIKTYLKANNIIAFKENSISINHSLSTYKPVLCKPAPSIYYGKGKPQLLSDGLKGNQDFTDRNWLAFNNTAIELIIDLTKSQNISEVKTNLLQKLKSDISYPTTLTLVGSSDGINYTIIDSISSEQLSKNNGLAKFNFPAKTLRFVKLKAEKPNNEKQWYFIDEIEVR